MSNQNKNMKTVQFVWDQIKDGYRHELEIPLEKESVGTVTALELVWDEDGWMLNLMNEDKIVYGPLARGGLQELLYYGMGFLTGSLS